MEVTHSEFNPPGRTTYELQKLNDVHLAIIRLLIQGKQNKEIAEALGVTEAMVVYTKRSAIVREKLDVMRAVLDMESIETAKMIQQLQPLAVMKLAEILAKEPDNRIVQQVARDVLDRGGHAAPKSPDMHVHAHITLDDINEIKQRAKERAREAGSLVEDAVVVAEE